MDKVNFTPFSEILTEDFSRQADYISTAFQLMVEDFLCQSTAATGLTVTAQPAANMMVYVKPGRLYQAGNQGALTANLDPALTITAAHPQYDRIDRICAQYKEAADTPETRNVMVDTVSRQVTQKSVMTRLAGALDFMVVSGVAAPGPAAPTVPDGWVSLAQVKVRAATTSILQTDILDERPTLTSLLTHAHSGGADGAKVDYNSLLNKPQDNSRVWKAGTTYGVGDICYPKNGASYLLLECTVGGVSGASEPTWPAVGNTVTDGTVTWQVKDLKNSGGEQVGSIKPWLANAAPPGWLALDTGALVSRATYPQLWAWVQAYAPLITEAAWQTQAATQTSVGAYSSGDGSTTFRLPRILDYPRGGLVNEVGTWQADDVKPHAHNAGTETSFTLGTAHTRIGVTSTGSVTNSLNSTGNSAGTETRPKTIKFLFCVKAFDAPVNQGLVDLTALANLVNLKVNQSDYAAGFANSLGQNGYQKLPSGLILQWGEYTSNLSQGATTINFPVAFPTSCLNVQATPRNTASSDQYDLFPQVVSKSNQSVTIYMQYTGTGTNLINGCTYIAIGY